MTGIDKIFEKTNISEEKKKSKKIFGRLLINLRKDNHIKLYALMEGVADTDMQDNFLIIKFNEKASYDMVNNTRDIEMLNTILGTIESGVKCKLECLNIKIFDADRFEEFLKKEFGKIMKIK